MSSQLRVDNILPSAGTALGIGTASGSITFNSSNISGDVIFNDDVTVNGLLTYEDVTNIDSVGIITARSGLQVTGGRVLVGTTDAGSNGTADDLVVANNSSASDQAGISIRGGTSGRSQIFFSDGTSGQDEYRGMLRYDHSENSMQFRTDAAERLRIDSAGRLLCGTSSGSGEPIAAFQGRSNDANDSGIVAITRTGTNPSGSIGELRFATGSDFNKYYAMVICQSDGSTTSTSLPGVLRFSTTASGSTSPTERMRITSGGVLSIGETDPSPLGGEYRGMDVGYKGSGISGRTGNPTFTIRSNIYYDGSNWKYGEGNTSAGVLSVGGNQLIFEAAASGTAGATATISEKFRINSSGNLVLPSGSGIDFSATSNSSGSTGSELLDDYEEGTFDPTIAPNSGGSITLNSGYNTLSYIKIGRLVYIGGQIRVSSVSSPVGNTNITNLPFTAQSTTEQGRAGANCFYYDASAGSGNYYKAVPIHVTEGTTTLKILNLHALGGITVAANDELTFAFSYVAAP